VTSRESFLQRVRQAVVEGNRAGMVPPHPTRGSMGYQGVPGDLVEAFCANLAVAGGKPHRAADAEAAMRVVLDLVQSFAARKVLVGTNQVVPDTVLAEHLRAKGCEAILVNALDCGAAKDPFFAADLGISGVTYLLAETGSLALATRPDEPRSVSLLPPIHVALAHRSQILPDLFDLFDRLGLEKSDGVPTMPSCLTIVTGPSKTGDIELRLVTGVHGPGEVHVVVCG